MSEAQSSDEETEKGSAKPPAKLSRAKPTPQVPVVKSQEAKTSDAKADLIRAVASPLNFFAFVVLVIEGLIGGTALLAHLSELHSFYVVLLMSALVAILVGVVGFITYNRPQNLSPEMAKALEKSEEAIRLAEENRRTLEENKRISEEMKKFLSSKALRDEIRDVLEQERESRSLPPPPTREQ